MNGQENSNFKKFFLKAQNNPERVMMARSLIWDTFPELLLIGGHGIGGQRIPYNAVVKYNTEG